MANQESEALAKIEIADKVAILITVHHNLTKNVSMSPPFVQLI